MASIVLSGILLDPNSDLAVGDQVRLTHESTTGQTLPSAQSLITIDPTGSYYIELQYGLVLVEYKDVRKQQFKNLGVVTVNSDNTATTLPALLNAIVPPTNPQLLQFQAILADAEAAKDLAEAAAVQITTVQLISSTATYGAQQVVATSGYGSSGDGGSVGWKQTGVTGQTPSQSPAQLGDGLLNDGNGNQWGIIDSKVNIAALGGLAGDVASALSASANGNVSSVTISNSVTCGLTQANAQLILKYINNIKVDGFLSFTFSNEEINLTDFININNESATRMSIVGVNTGNLTITGFTSVSGVAKNYSVTIGVSDTSEIDVGNYIITNNQTLAGTGRFKELAGCWKVTSKSASSITFKHTHHQSSFPTMTLTGGTVNPVKSVIRWANGSRGLSVFNCDLSLLSDIVLAGSFDISTTAGSDGTNDGLQVGSEANTSDTGQTQSRTVNSGSIYASALGVVEWQNNGVQILGGYLHAPGMGASSNGHRGIQSAGNGSALIKFSSSSGNSASGYEAEALGSLDASGGFSVGNGQQGVYCIGVGFIAFSSSGYTGGNLFAGIDSRDGGVVAGNTATSSGNSLDAITSDGGYITVQNGVVSGPVRSLNAGHIELGSSSVTSSYVLDEYSSIKLSDGKYYSSPFFLFPVLPVLSGVSYTDNGTIATYKVINGMLFWKISLRFTGLDTADLSTCTIDNFPLPMDERNGSAKFSFRSTTGLVFLASDTYQLDYNTITDSVVFSNSAGTLLKYNGGQFQSSGKIEMSGWFEV